MKKIRIELKPGVKSKKLTLFESLEALYSWSTEGMPEKSFGMIDVEMCEGEFVEVEWVGCETSPNESGEWVRYDLIRLAKGTPTKNASGMLAAIHFGWMIPGNITFNDREDADSYTIKLLTPADWRLDLGLLFQDEVPSATNDPKKNACSVK